MLHTFNFLEILSSINHLFKAKICNNTQGGKRKTKQQTTHCQLEATKLFSSRQTEFKNMFLSPLLHLISIFKHMFL